MTKDASLQEVIFKIFELAVLSNERFSPADNSFADLWHQVIRSLNDCSTYAAGITHVLRIFY
jgi:hypothetical protein